MKKTCKKILNIVLIILVIIAVILIITISRIYIKRNKTSRELQTFSEKIKEEIEVTKEEEEVPYIEHEGYQVIGIIKISKINIEYPILIDTTEDALKKSITRVGNGTVNGIGNLILAGHNYLNGTMFGKANKLATGDEISILDLHGQEVNYQIFDKYVINPNDVDALQSVEANTREITLITCINGNKNRLIIKAREINK